MIKAIAFDLWETLITNTSDATRSHKQLRLEKIERILAERGVAPAAERMEHAYRHSWTRCQELYWSANKDVPCRTQVGHFVEALELELDEPALHAVEEAYAMVAVEVLPSIVPGAVEVLEDVKRRGYRTGLISNTGRTPGYALRRILERLDLSRFFDAMVFSNEHGELKPEPSIFEALRRSLDVSFHDMVFIGDNVYADVYGAQRCGMIGVHFVPPQRGTAVAPDVDHGLTISPDATIYDLRELLALDFVQSPQSAPSLRG